MRGPAAAMVVLLLVTACGDAVEEDDPIATGLVESTVPAETTTTQATTTTTAAPATTATPTTASVAGTDPAPWGTASLPGAAVPEVLISQWQQAENRESCSALYPQGDLPGDAAVRSAQFGGGWAVAWDRPDGPGRFATGEYCDDCGRGAFGVAGAGIVANGDEDGEWPQRLAWDDGSRAGYGYEGRSDGSSGEPHLMYLLVRGEGCLYNVWSFLGEDHLLDLVAALRFVDGLSSEPTAAGSEAPAPDLVELGEPAWVTEAPLAATNVSGLYELEWAGEAQAPESCPLLAFADLGPEAADATIRRAASEGEMLLAWDRPAGPGHDTSGEPCAECGRGAVGLGTFQDGAIGDRPVTREWSDGSRAATFDGIYGTEAFLEPAGFSCVYWLWSHLGQEHLDHLFTQLRRVDGFP